MKKNLIYILGILVVVTGLFFNSVVFGETDVNADSQQETSDNTIESVGSGNSGLGKGFNQSIIDGLNKQAGTDVIFQDQLYKIWNTFKWCVWILSFVGIFVAGLRYIFAGVDDKSDLKQGLGKLVIGIILVDAASLIIEIIVKIFYEVV